MTDLPVYDGPDLRITYTAVDPAGIDAIRDNRARTEASGLPAYRPAKVRDGTAAIVGYGPSLKDTWPRLRDFDGAIWTVSGAHDFLLERGVVPTYHVDVDYRPHKALMNARTHPAVGYVLATHVHEDYWKKLVENGRVPSFFHIWLVGGVGGGVMSMKYPKVDMWFDAGLTAAALAYDAGYRKQEWFGIDASRPDTVNHAGAHNGVVDKIARCVVKVNGVRYQSNELWMRQALYADKLIRSRAHLNVTVHGDGLMRPFLLARKVPRVG